MGKIAKGFNGYVDSVYDEEPGLIQSQEIKRAFYAGAAVCLSSVLEHDTVEDTLLSISDLVAELGQYKKLVKVGEE